MGLLIQGLSPAWDASAAPALFTIDATTDFWAARRMMLSTSPIIKVEWFCDSKTGTPGNLEIVLCADAEGIPNVSGGVPVDIGGGSPTLVSLAAASVTSGARHTTTFTNPYTPAAGEYVWVVFYPGAGGSGFSASHRYIFRQAFVGFGTIYGDEQSAISTNTGTAWTRSTSVPYISLLTTADAYLPASYSICPDNVSQVTWDDADTPDERGTAWTVPANCTGKVYGAHHMMRLAALTSDFDFSAYLDTTQLATRAVDASKLEVAVSGRMNTLLFNAPPVNISSAGTGRVTFRATHATDGIREAIISCGSQSRRESCFLFKDYWYTHRNGGSGSFTDDLTTVWGALPIVEHNPSGGGSETFTGAVINRGIN